MYKKLHRIRSTGFVSRGPPPPTGKVKQKAEECNRPRGSYALPERHERVSSGIEQRRPSHWETEHNVGIQLQNVLSLREVVRPQIGPLPNVFPQPPWPTPWRPVAHFLRNADLMDSQFRESLSQRCMCHTSDAIGSIQLPHAAAPLPLARATLKALKLMKTTPARPLTRALFARAGLGRGLSKGGNLVAEMVTE